MPHCRNRSRSSSATVFAIARLPARPCSSSIFLLRAGGGGQTGSSRPRRVVAAGHRRGSAGPDGSGRGRNSVAQAGPQRGQPVATLLQTAPVLRVVSVSDLGAEITDRGVEQLPIGDRPRTRRLTAMTIA